MCVPCVEQIRPLVFQRLKLQPAQNYIILIDEYERIRQMEKEIDKIQKQREEQAKINLKKTDIKKYQLFYGK